MGRWSTNSITVNECSRLELSWLFKDGYIKKGSMRRGSINWTNGNSISFESVLDDNKAYLRIWYTLTDKDTNQKTEYDYKIRLVETPSNLGRGSLVYFICPVSRTLCRKLYMAYGSEVFKARTAYQNRLYYPQQMESKTPRTWGDAHKLEDQLCTLYKKRRYDTHNGQKTKRILKIEKLTKKIRKMDMAFCQFVDSRFGKFI